MQYADLNSFNNSSFSRGAPFWKEALWRLTSALLFESSWMHLPGIKSSLLRLFGTSIGDKVLIKPGVKIKFPWKLTIGDCSWIGEDVWIDNLVHVTIGSNCCISQGTYVCTGSHDWSRKSFDLMTEEIVIEDSVWLAAQSVVGPGVTVGEGAVLTIGSVATKNLKAGWVHQGNPALPIRERPHSKE